ncbi:hypothetical protein HMSSN036_76340 [Paenibacillus macerans]|nr:hypothetical protein HMSSN036_76340 [Paenibacillus macerans]
MGAAERGSEHPLADAVVAGARARGLDLPEATAFEAVPGHGITAAVLGRRVLAGTRRLMAREGVDVSAALPEMAALEAAGNTVLLASVDGVYAGMVAVSDTVKDTSKAAVVRLKAMGLHVVMITATMNARRRRSPPRSASTRCSPRCCRKAKPPKSKSCRSAA